MDYAFVSLRLRRSRITTGIAVSLVLHALLLSAWHRNTPGKTDDTPEPRRELAVWLRPPAPPPVAHGDIAQTRPVPRQQRPHVSHQPPRPMVAVESTPDETPPREPLVVQQQPSAAAQQPDSPTPQFDRDVALKLARRFANDPDPATADLPIGQLPKKPLRSESRAAQAIASAGRPYCKDGIPGGLLAPLFLLMDKKNSGCRW